jgi:hypothetical protein
MLCENPVEVYDPVPIVQENQRVAQLASLVL